VDVTPSREQVVLFEPRADMRVSDQAAFHELLAKPRRLLVNPVVWLLAIACVVGLFLPGHPVGVAGPTIIALAILISFVVNVRQTQFLSRAEFTALTDHRPRQVTLDEGDLLRSGRDIAIRLAGEEQWAVTRLPSADATMLARLRRVWVFGPTPGGRIGLMVPGGGAPRVVRLVATPSAGATPLPAPPAPAEWPTPPKDDPAVVSALNAKVRASLYSIAVMVVLIGMLTFDTLVVEDSGSLADWGWWLPTVFLALLALVSLGEIGRTVRATRSTRWAWTRVAAEEPYVVNAARLKVRVRVDAPGNEVYLEVSGPPAVVLSVYEAKGVWLIGELGARRPMIVGIPEVPAVGRARVVRPPR
jgi:hypothetical protein